MATPDIDPFICFRPEKGYDYAPPNKVIKNAVFYVTTSLVPAKHTNQHAFFLSFGSHCVESPFFPFHSAPAFPAKENVYTLECSKVSHDDNSARGLSSSSVFDHFQQTQGVPRGVSRLVVVEEAVNVFSGGGP